MENKRRHKGEENAKRNGHQPPAKPGDPKWTVMVYLAGDNNLTSNCITVLQQLEAVQYTSNIRVLACFDSNNPWPKGSRYLAINGKRRRNNKGLDWEIYNDLIITRKRKHEIETPDFCSDAEVIQGDPMKRTDVAEGLKRFMYWAMDQGHSDRYMLVLYGHGPVVAGKTFLARENPVSSLRMTDLPKILAPHFRDKERKLDILAFQNCAMNGIETAYEMEDQVDYMIGSQGLVLSYGWPYEGIISAIVKNPGATPLEISEKVLKVCARHLIDFTVMDRSSEQSVCDLSKLRSRKNITEAIKELGAELQGALGFKLVRTQKRSQDKERKVLEYPVICDAVRLARLEAQSYWGETFVDIYDFCERLLKKCNAAILAHKDFMSNSRVNGKVGSQIRETELVSKLRRIARCCVNVMERVEEMVPYSYYIGPDLQYSRGLSIYFPWSMPGEPYSFYFRPQHNDHVLVTAFETYSNYRFVKESGWAGFLKLFYRATLRKVRRAHRRFRVGRVDAGFSRGMVHEIYEAPSTVLTTEQLQKTDSDHGSVDYNVWSNVKNYPRRNYLSPSDCPRKVEKAGRHRPGTKYYPNRNSPPVSYLGWNICEFVADVIRRKPSAGKRGNNRGRKVKERSPKKAVPGALLPSQERPPADRRP